MLTKRDRSQPTIDLLLATKAVVERDLELGLVSERQLRFTIDARKEAAKQLAAKGLSTRQIAKVTGASKSQIARDNAVPNGTENVPSGTPSQAHDPAVERDRQNKKLIQHGRRAAEDLKSLGSHISCIEAAFRLGERVLTREEFDEVRSDFRRLEQLMENCP